MIRNMHNQFRRFISDRSKAVIRLWFIKLALFILVQLLVTNDVVSSRDVEIVNVSYTKIVSFAKNM